MATPNSIVSGISTSVTLKLTPAGNVTQAYIDGSPVSSPWQITKSYSSAQTIQALVSNAGGSNTCSVSISTYTETTPTCNPHVEWLTWNRGNCMGNVKFTINTNNTQNYGYLSVKTTDDYRVGTREGYFTNAPWSFTVNNVQLQNCNNKSVPIGLYSPKGTKSKTCQVVLLYHE
jgi:hypothetical protein